MMTHSHTTIGGLSADLNRRVKFNITALEDKMLNDLVKGGIVATRADGVRQGIRDLYEKKKTLLTDARGGGKPGSAVASVDDDLGLGMLQPDEEDELCKAAL